MAAPRIQTFRAFFSYYLGEHEIPFCRALHFAGTTVVVALLATTIAHAASTRPLWLVPSLAGGLLCLVIGHQLEKRMAAFVPLLGFIACLAPLHPSAVLGAVVAGYGFAWPAHFLVEKNRPATFRYPLWSLASDFRMWALMLRGRLWSKAPAHEQAGVPAFDGTA